MSAPVALPPRFGRYAVLSLLGAGGMGTVYLAEDTLLSRKVALKIPLFKIDAASQMQERFLREARAAAAIEHPNLCPVHDVGEIDGMPYLVMPYIEGRPLSRLIDEGPPWEQPRAFELVRKLAAAMQVMHDRGIIHRDLKPGNVMIRLDGEPVIMDFGLARLLEPQGRQLTNPGSTVGTPSYMAPEQVLGDLNALGPATDVYALGVVLYELITGRLPFEGPPAVVYGRILSVDPEPPSSLRADVAPWLDAVCLKALAKPPEERFASMSEFAAALSSVPVVRTDLSASVASRDVSAVTEVLRPSEPGPKPRRRWWIAAAACPAVIALAIWLMFRPGQREDWKPDPKQDGREIVNSIGMRLVPIPAGKFWMGSPPAEKEQVRKEHGERAGDAADTEVQHEVEINRPFYMGVHEVTQEQYEQVLERTPSSFSSTGEFKEKVEGIDTKRFPVENVSWEDARQFCATLSVREDEKKAGRVYRLPTEAEWEYACRGGETARDNRPFHFKQPTSILTSAMANIDGRHPHGTAEKGEYLKRPTTVGSYPANAFGLHDMHGNVWEWCEDRFGPYDVEDVKDPMGAKDGPDKRRVLRGGSFYSQGHGCRAASRNSSLPTQRLYINGFRVVCDVGSR